MKIEMVCEDLDLRALANMSEALQKWYGLVKIDIKPSEEEFKTKVTMTKEEF